MTITINLQILAGKAEMSGIDLNAAASPPVL